MYHPLFQFIDSSLAFEKINQYEQIKKYNYRWCVVKSKSRRLTGEFSNNNPPIIIGLVMNVYTQWSGGETGPTLVQIWPRDKNGYADGYGGFNGAMIPSNYGKDFEIRYLSIKEKENMMIWIKHYPTSVKVVNDYLEPILESMNKWE
jgi:hypothetical protein